MHATPRPVVTTIAGSDVEHYGRLFWQRLVAEQLADVDELGDREIPLYEPQRQAAKNG
jgi:hypothetical protein